MKLWGSAFAVGPWWFHSPPPSPPECPQPFVTCHLLCFMIGSEARTHGACPSPIRCNRPVMGGGAFFVSRSVWSGGAGAVAHHVSFVLNIRDISIPLLRPGLVCAGRGSPFCGSVTSSIRACKLKRRLLWCIAQSPLAPNSHFHRGSVCLSGDWLYFKAASLFPWHQVVFKNGFAFFFNVRDQACFYACTPGGVLWAGPGPKWLCLWDSAAKVE